MDKDKIIEPEKTEEVISKKQQEKNNRLLRIIFISIGLILLVFFATYFFVESKKSFECKGVEFNTVQEGELTFYNTQVPIYSEQGKQISVYNFYLRTDPRELEKMEFNGTIEPMKLMALNYSNDINCSGYGIIALQNIISLYQLIGAKVSVDKNATCDKEGRYMLLNIQKTNENKIEQIGNNCYNLKIKECDVFPTTEKFMLESFVRIKEKDIHIIASSSGELLNK
jgi:hypothetical protein